MSRPQEVEAPPCSLASLSLSSNHGHQEGDESGLLPFQSLFQDTGLGKEGFMIMVDCAKALSP